MTEKAPQNALVAVDELQTNDLGDSAQPGGLGADPPFELEIVEDTPEIVIDLGRLQRNVDRAAAAAAACGVALRPHTKTHKMINIASMQMDAGAVGIQVAKLGEAEVFAQAGCRDIFIGYPLVGSRKISRLIELIGTTGTKVSVAVDSLEVAVPIARAAVAADLTVPVLIEVDTGLRRLGTGPGDPTRELATALTELRGIELIGLFTHEGHIYTQAQSTEEKRIMTREACSALAETADLIRASGIPLATVSVGSSATFRFAIECAGVTEVRPGTYVFNDLSQLRQGAASPADLAAFVVATVVGRPEANRAVIDAGSKVLTSDRLITSDPGTTFGHVLGHSGARVARLSEEHGVLEVSPTTKLKVGDRVAIVPNHICPVINLADSVSVVADGELVDRWTVSTRGHVK